LTATAPRSGLSDIAAGDTSVGVVWVEDPSGSPTTWFQRVQFDGTPIGSPTAIPTGRNASIAWNGSEWALAWGSGGFLYTMRIAADGTTLSTAALRGLTTAYSFVRLTWSSTLGWVAVGGFSFSPNVIFVALGVDASTPSAPISLGVASGLGADIAAAPDGSLLMIHTYHPSGWVAQPINADGSVTAGATPIVPGTNSLRGLAWDGRTYVAALTSTTGSTTDIAVLRGPTLASRLAVRRQTGATNAADLAVRDRRLVLSWPYAPADGIPRDLWTARLLSPDAVAGAPTILSPPMVVSSATTVEAATGVSVAYVDDDHVHYGWTDTRWGLGEVYTMSASLGTCR